MAYDSWVGPAYLSGLAGELGMAVGLVAFIAAIPAIGAVGPLLTASLHGRSLRASTLAFASFSRALWLIPLLLAGIGVLRGKEFPAALWFRVTAIVACVSALSGTSGGATWMSWLRALIPGGFRGRFFGVRNRYVMLAQVAAHILAAFYIGWKPGGYYLGYAILGTFAVISAAVSTLLLSKVADAPADPVAARPVSARSMLEPLRDPGFRRVLVFGACFQGAIQLASPYWPYYFTRELHIPMALVATWIMLGSLGSFAAAGFWGRRIDRAGDPASTLIFGAVLASLAPLIYSVASPSLVPWIAPIDYFSNGLYFSGYQLSMSTLLLKSAPPGRNVTYFALNTACTGLLSALGAFAGGWLAVHLAPWGGFRALWVVSSCARLAVVGSLFLPGIAGFKSRSRTAGFASSDRRGSLDLSR
jgi:hypothetical protein